MNEFVMDQDQIFNDYSLRETIIREMAEQNLWVSQETVPDDLLKEFDMD